MKRMKTFLTIFFAFAALSATCGIEARAQTNDANAANQSTNSAAQATGTLKVGDRAQVLWKDGKTYQAHIVEVKDGAYKVHYDGYDASLDETVAALAVSRAGNSTAPPNIAASLHQDWKIGDKVAAQWSKDGKYYGAAIVNVEGGRYKVHYLDEKDDSGDEWRETAQIRPHKDWTWTDAAGQVKMPQDLQDIIERHKQWLASGGGAGAQANFAGAKLTGANFSTMNLTRANFEKANLTEAKFIGAILTGANLKGADVSRGDMSSAILDSADFTGAMLSGTDFSGSLMEKANLTRAFLVSAKMNKAFLMDANLTGASVNDADLSDASFDRANLKDVYYEPKKNPEIRYIVSALNLETLKYGVLPDALGALRKEFKDGGFTRQESKITYAVKRSENEILWNEAFQTKCVPAEGADSQASGTPCVVELGRGRDCPGGVCESEPQNILFYYLNIIFFDWTVRYGMRPERALIMLFFLWLICAVIYDLFIHYPGKDGIYLLKTRKHRDPVRTRGLRIVPHRLNTKHLARHHRWWHWWRREWRIFRLGMFFSLITTFSIGFKEFDVGRWLGMLTKREYELLPRHWTRTVAGFQSLLSLYLIAMWILCHFGQPFE